MKKSVSFISLIFLTLNLFAETQQIQGAIVRQQKLSAENSSWTSVISGTALCAPKKTSYGFAVLTDGKMISACSENGTKLWERGVPGRPDPYLTVFSKDFLLTVSNGNNLSLINPSGLTLWTVKVPFDINSDPFIGRDSRIIVKGKKNLACYGVNGICKWTLTTDQLKNAPVYELNDGTMLCLLESVKDGKSSAIRFTPFGEIIENINFTGIIQSACSCTDGVLLSFNGGGAGMCSVKENITGTQWSIPYSDRAFSNTTPVNGSIFSDLGGHRSALFIAGNGIVKTRTMVFSTIDGRVSDWFNVDCNFKEISCISPATNSDSIFFSDTSQGLIYDTTGRLLWNGLLPTGSDLFSRWNFITFTKGNFLVICSKSWAMAGFRTTYKLAKKNQVKNKKADYRVFYELDTVYSGFLNLSDKIDSKYTGINRQQILKKGNYGQKEIQYISSLLSINQAYSEYLSTQNSRGSATGNSIFKKDQTGLQDILFQYSLFGIDTFPPLISSIIKSETDDTNLQSILRSVSSFGYDPDGSILNSIDIKTKKIPCTHTSDLILTCDAVYEICRFMGRPALYSHGMEILTGLLYPQYNSEVKDYARSTLTKIAGLKI